MELVSNFCFYQRIYGVNFERIDNDPHSTTISTVVAREIFEKSESWCVIFLWSSITYLNGKKRVGVKIWNDEM